MPEAVPPAFDSLCAAPKSVNETIDSETVALVRKVNDMLAAPPPPSLPPMEAARRAASEIFQAFAGVRAPVTTEDITLPGADGDIRARRYIPSANAAASGMIVFLHGGGWMLGALDDYDALLSRLADRTGVQIISLDYRLAPEHPFPAALDDARTAISWLIGHAGQFGFDPARCGVMGDSAGGNLAAVLALESGDAFPIAAQYLLYPMLDVSSPHDAYPSRLNFGDGDYFLTREAIDAATQNYLKDDALVHDPRVSPIRAPSLAGAPPAYILVGACDPLRDEARAYAARLSTAGVDVKFDCAPNAIHALLSFGILSTSQRAETRLVKVVSSTLRSKL